MSGMGSRDLKAIKKKATILGFSAMVLKSAILAMVGLVAFAAFYVWKVRK